MEKIVETTCGNWGAAKGHVGGRCKRCDLLYIWKRYKDRPLTKARCRCCNRKLAATCVATMKNPHGKLVDRDPKFPPPPHKSKPLTDEQKEGLRRLSAEMTRKLGPIMGEILGQAKRTQRIRKRLTKFYDETYYP